MNNIIKTLVILKTQVTDMWGDVSRTSLTYAADFTGNDDQYVKSFEKNLVDEVVGDCDFWECVKHFKESFCVRVSVLGSKDMQEKYELHLTKLIASEIISRIGSDVTIFLKCVIEPKEEKSKQAVVK